MRLLLMTEPNVRKSQWSVLYINAIYTEAKRHSIPVCESTPSFSGANEAEKLPDEFGAMPGEHVIILGNMLSWITAAAVTATKMGLRPLIVNAEPSPEFPISSYVLMDFEEAIFKFLDYLISHDKKRVALFAVNVDSAADKAKESAFIKYKGATFTRNDVFYYTDNTNAICDEFIRRIDDYDSVICTNALSGGVLLERLEEHSIKVPDDIWMCAVGMMFVGKQGKPLFTFARSDCTAIGRLAAELYFKLTENHMISSTVIKRSYDYLVRETTANTPFNDSPVESYHVSAPAPDMFREDPLIGKILQAESIMSQCDNIDMQILSALVADKKYSEIAEELFVSLNTVKYRMKRLLTISGFTKREELIEVLEQFLN